MVNAEIRTLHAADGTPVCNVSFDLSAMQVTAAVRAVDAIRLHRHQNAELSTDDVLALRELTGVSDELHRLAEGQAHASVVLPLARFAALHDAIGEWVHLHDDRGWMREDDADVHPVAAAMLDPMATVREDALHAVLGDSTHAHDGE